MGPYLGDYAKNAIIFFTWDTNGGNGASINPTVAGTISVYKDDDLVQSVAGITDTRAFDGIVGLHNVKIDTANAFYSVGHDYHVILSAATIDTQVVNATLAEFSIENRLNPVDTDLALHLGAGVGGRNIGNILGQLAQSEFELRTNVFATIAVPAQGITASMARKGVIQYQQVDMSYTKAWGAPDRTFYILYHYNAQQKQDMAKSSLGIVW
jgi:hypothetical protein